MNCGEKSCCKKAAGVIRTMQNTCVRCHLGMNFEVYEKNCPGIQQKQWRSQKDCCFSLLDVAVVGVAVLTAVLIGSCCNKRKKKNND